MFFKLYVTLFLITNGVVAEHPSGMIPNKKVFPTQEACTQFLESDDGKKAMVYLETVVGQTGKQFKMETTCAADGVSL